MADVALRPATTDDDEIFLGLIELAPEYQGRGIGSRLIRELIDGAGGKRVTLSVLGVNDRAYQLYRRLGFTEVSRDGVAPEVRIRMAVGVVSRDDMTRAGSG